MYGHNIASLAHDVIGQNWSGEMVSLFLEYWELTLVAFSRHLALDLLCQEMREACPGSPLSAAHGRVPVGRAVRLHPAFGTFPGARTTLGAADLLR